MVIRVRAAHGRSPDLTGQPLSTTGPRPRADVAGQFRAAGAAISAPARVPSRRGRAEPATHGSGPRLNHQSGGRPSASTAKHYGAAPAPCFLGGSPAPASRPPPSKRPRAPVGLADHEDTVVGSGDLVQPQPPAVDHDARLGRRRTTAPPDKDVATPGPAPTSGPGQKDPLNRGRRKGRADAECVNRLSGVVVASAYYLGCRWR
jgi:hypothetical protein